MEQRDRPNSRDQQRSAFFANPIEQQPLWRGLYQSVRDRLFPPELPPVELTSTPVPVADRMAANTNPWAIGTATIINSGIVVLVIVLGLRGVNHPPAFTDPVDKFVIKELPLFAPLNTRSVNGGSGGGTNDPIEAIRGHNPKQDMHPLAPVKLPVLADPKLAIENRIAVPPDVRLPDNPDIATIGVHSSTNVTLVSGGPGGPVGIGSGDGGGDGPGHGQNGWGAGSQEGIYWPGRDGVTRPVPIFTPEAEFSDEARRHKHQGACTVSVIIDAHGVPRDPHVVQSIGMGLDEKALEAVMRYRFKPAEKHGRPVASRIAVVVNFRLY
jgi:periplasmic protein TonB